MRKTRRRIPGLRVCLGIFVALVAVVVMQWGVLLYLKKGQERRRVANGKPSRVVNESMQNHANDESVDRLRLETGRRVAGTRQ